MTIASRRGAILGEPAAAKGAFAGRSLCRGRQFDHTRSEQAFRPVPQGGRIS